MVDHLNVEANCGIRDLTERVQSVMNFLMWKKESLMSDSQLKGENRIIIEIEVNRKSIVVENGSGFKLHKYLNKNIFQENEENVKQNVEQINENDQVQKVWSQAMVNRQVKYK